MKFIQDVCFHILSKDDLCHLMEGFPIDHETMNIPVYSGFYYFSPYDFRASEIGTRFIIATYDSEVVGVMKIKRYAFDDHRYVRESEKDYVRNYIAIRYVDVAEEWKRKTIATNLYRELNDFVNDQDIVVGSPLSSEGKKANLGLLRNTIITNALVVDNINKL